MSNAAVNPFQVKISCLPQPLTAGNYQVSICHTLDSYQVMSRVASSRGDHQIMPYRWSYQNNSQGSCKIGDGVWRQGPSRRGVCTPESAGRLAYTFVLQHEHCFKKALGHKWGAGVTILSRDPQKHPYRLPLLKDPGRWIKTSTHTGSQGVGAFIVYGQWAPLIAHCGCAHLAFEAQRCLAWLAVTLGLADRKAHTCCFCALLCIQLDCNYRSEVLLHCPPVRALDGRHLSCERHRPRYVAKLGISVNGEAMRK